MHVKKGTSGWLKTQSPEYADFDWQEGYCAFSIGRSQRDEVAAYIRKQQEKHSQISFQDEFRKLLTSYEIEYDEQYVWAEILGRTPSACQPRASLTQGDVRCAHLPWADLPCTFGAKTDSVFEIGIWPEEERAAIEENGYLIISRV
jgi:Transposase IS200 like